MKKGIKLIILCGVMLLFIGGYLLLKYLPGESEIVESNSSAVMVKYEDTSNLTEISYTMSESEMNFTNEDGTWFWKADKDFPLDTDIVDAMATALCEITASRLVADNLDNASDYGLDEPSFSFKATFGDSCYIVELGDNNEITSSYYMKINGDNKIYLVDESFLDNFDYTLYELANTDSLESVDTTTVTSVSASQNGNTVILTSDKGGTDYENDDSVYIAKYSDGSVKSLEAETSTDFISGSCGVALSTVVDFKPSDETKATYGLSDSSAVSVDITYEKEVESGTDDTEATVTSTEHSTYTIGRAQAEDGSFKYYAYVSNSNLIYSVLNSDGSDFFNSFDVLSLS